MFVGMDVFQSGIGVSRVHQSFSSVIGYIQNGFILHGGKGPGINLVEQFKVKILLDEARQQAVLVAMIAVDEFKEGLPGNVFGILAQAGNDMAPVGFLEDEGLIVMVGHEAIEGITIFYTHHHVFGLRSRKMGIIMLLIMLSNFKDSF